MYVCAAGSKSEEQFFALRQLFLVLRIMHHKIRDLLMDRSAHIQLAEVARYIRRYADLLDHMIIVTTSFPQELSTHECDILSIGLKSKLFPPRAALHTLNAIILESSAEGLPYLKSYQKRIEIEICDICNEVLSLLNSKCIAQSPKFQMTFFHLKTKADFLRYRAECQHGNLFIDTARKAHEAYSKALYLAKKNLSCTNSQLLGLVLNYAVFFHDVLHDRNSACILGKREYDCAYANLNDLAISDFEASATVMQSLQDNLSMWSNNSHIDWTDDDRIAFTFDDYLTWNHKVSDGTTELELEPSPLFEDSSPVLPQNSLCASPPGSQIDLAMKRRTCCCVSDGDENLENINRGQCGHFSRNADNQI